MVETGQSVITGVSATETANGSTQFQNTRENAGLTVDLSVSKIDDNGFISLELKPEISVPIPAGTQEGVGRRCRNLQHSGSKIGVWKHPPP